MTCISLDCRLGHIVSEWNSDPYSMEYVVEHVNVVMALTEAQEGIRKAIIYLKCFAANSSTHILMLEEVLKFITGSGTDQFASVEDPKVSNVKGGSETENVIIIENIETLIGDISTPCAVVIDIPSMDAQITQNESIDFPAADIDTTYVKTESNDPPPINMHTQNNRNENIDFPAADIDTTDVKTESNDPPAINMLTQNTRNESIDFPASDSDTIDEKMETFDLPTIDMDTPNTPNESSDLTSMNMCNPNVQTEYIDMPTVCMDPQNMQADNEMHIPDIQMERIDLSNVHVDKPEEPTKSINLPHIDLDAHDAHTESVDLPNIDMDIPDTLSYSTDMQTSDLDAPDIHTFSIDLPTVFTNEPFGKIENLDINVHKLDMADTSSHRKVVSRSKRENKTIKIPISRNCEQCGKILSNLRGLEDDSEIKQFKCEECGELDTTVESNQSLLLQALTIVSTSHSGHVPKANIPQPKNKSDSSIKNKPNSLVCKQCDKVMVTVRGYKTHMLGHSSIKPHQCEECGHRFSYKGSLTKHMKQNHQGERPYKCESCPKTFVSPSLLTEHMTVHTGETRYVCDICSDRFYWLSHLERHMKIHEQRSHTCEVCGKLFRHLWNLTDHMKTHTGLKPYGCPHCDKKFAHAVCVKGHLRAHNGEKPYICDICQSKFTTPGSLRQHMRVHNGQRYECPECSGTFTQSGSLRTHMRLHQRSATDMTVKDELV